MSSVVKKSEEYELDGHKVLIQLIWDKSDGGPWWQVWIDGQDWPYRFSWWPHLENKPSKSRVKQVIEQYF